MADDPAPSQAQVSPIVAIPATRRLEEDHVPTISSPLNPDAISRGRPTKQPAREREQREKKESLKKRESAASVRGKTPDVKTKSKVTSDVPSPMRFTLTDPKPSDYDPPKDTIFASHEPYPIYTPDGQIELKKSVDHAENKKAYRYHVAVADPLFCHQQYFRQSDMVPYHARMSVEDSDRNIHFDSSTRIITNGKGWRASRANVFAREGSLYYEIKILKGISASADPLSSDPQPHVRVGWARREAPLDAPIGFDGFSYAITDTGCDTIHRSRLGKFIPLSTKAKSKAKKQQAPQNESPMESLYTNDVAGLLITLPPLPLHRKVVAGTYNPAVDFSSAPDPNAPPPDIIRDRIPVPYRGNNYFENWEYQPTKQMTSYGDRGPGNAVRPHPNHEEAPLRSLPGSSIKVYKNGVLVGTAFEDLMAFLPPASAPGAAPNVRTGFDDGSLGYYPAVSLFSGGIAEMNFGPDFWCPPADLNMSQSEDVQMEGAPEESSRLSDDAVMRPRPICERYKEQVAEDIVWDIIDEAAFFAQDGGYNFVPKKESRNETDEGKTVHHHAIGNLREE